jgi:hypothetical protein
MKYFGFPGRSDHRIGKKFLHFWEAANIFYEDHILVYPVEILFIEC